MTRKPIASGVVGFNAIDVSDKQVFAKHVAQDTEFNAYNTSLSLSRSHTLNASPFALFEIPPHFKQWLCDLTEDGHYQSDHVRLKDTISDRNLMEHNEYVQRSTLVKSEKADARLLLMKKNNLDFQMALTGESTQRIDILRAHTATFFALIVLLDFEKQEIARQQFLQQEVDCRAIFHANYVIFFQGILGISNCNQQVENNRQLILAEHAKTMATVLELQENEQRKNLKHTQVEENNELKRKWIYTKEIIKREKITSIFMRTVFSLKHSCLETLEQTDRERLEKIVFFIGATQYKRFDLERKSKIKAMQNKFQKDQIQKIREMCVLEPTPENALELMGLIYNAYKNVAYEYYDEIKDLVVKMTEIDASKLPEKHKDIFFRHLTSMQIIYKMLVALLADCDLALKSALFQTNVLHEAVEQLTLSLPHIITLHAFEFQSKIDFSIIDEFIKLPIFRVYPYPYIQHVNVPTQEFLKTLGRLYCNYDFMEIFCKNIHCFETSAPFDERMFSISIAEKKLIQNCFHIVLRNAMRGEWQGTELQIMIAQCLGYELTIPEYLMLKHTELSGIICRVVVNAKANFNIYLTLFPGIVGVYKDLIEVDNTHTSQPTQMPEPPAL